jgi:hypothetical protein
MTWKGLGRKSLLSNQGVVLSRKFRGAAEEKHERSELVSLVTQPWFETVASRLLM